jgi:hypothetical protein
MEPQMTQGIQGMPSEGNPYPVTPVTGVPMADAAPGYPVPAYTAAIGTATPVPAPPMQRNYRRSGEWRW